MNLKNIFVVCAVAIVLSFGWFGYHNFEENIDVTINGIKIESGGECLINYRWGEQSFPHWEWGSCNALRIGDTAKYKQEFYWWFGYRLDTVPVKAWPYTPKAFTLANYAYAISLCYLLLTFYWWGCGSVAKEMLGIFRRGRK